MDGQPNASLSAGIAAHPLIDRIMVEAGDTAQLSMHQLQSAIADISRALNEVLRDERTNVAMYLRRAENFLRPVARPGASPIKKTLGVRQPLSSLRTAVLSARFGQVVQARASAARILNSFLTVVVIET